MSKILIVEDDDLNFELASELLGRAGHEIAWAKNGHECLSFLDNNIPDLILMDMRLPAQDGFSLTQTIKANPALQKISIVACTAMAMQKDKEKAISAGCNGYISKPFNISSFVKTVEDFIQPKYIPHNILVIDDNRMNTEIIKEALEVVNQKVIVAHNGENVINTILQEKIDLVMLDIIMPDINGFDILRQIKSYSETVDLPVIFVSALDNAQTIAKGFDLGSYEYIVKPFNIDELRARVLNILKIKDLQDKLRAEMKIIDVIFEFSADGIVLLNSKFEILSCNDIFLKWLNKTRIQVLYKKFCDVINCPKKPCQNGHNKDGDYFEVELITETSKLLGVKCSKVYAATGEVDGFVFVLRDITEQMKIEAQKETFVATLTHDLKTPVLAQIKALQILLDKKLGNFNSVQEEILAETLNSNKYLISMLENLLSTYKYENGNVNLNKTEFNINALIKNCCKDLKYLLKEKHLEFVLDFNEESIMIYADQIEIKRVIINLLSNAINYSNKNGKITISTEKRGDMSILLFKDEGKGISYSELPLLFNKFTSYAKKFRQVGTGLGLYLSKHILELHGGDIGVESKEGKGSKFIVTLPIIF